MINALQWVSISDFILAALCLFLSGILYGKLKSNYSREAMLAHFLLFAGLAAFMGGIDHGFFEPINKRFIPRILTYFFIAVATFSLFYYLILSYFKGNWKRILTFLAISQLIAFIASSFLIDNFLLVVLNYAPVLLMFFLLNLINARNSEHEKIFSIFCVVLITATLIQVFGIGISDAINGDTLFHIVAFIGYFFFFFGAKSLIER